MRHKRKKYLVLVPLLILLSVWVSSNTWAQIYLGPKAGARISWLNYEELDKEQYSQSPRFTYAAGATVAFKVQKRFLLQLDVLYSQSGYSLKQNNDGPQFSNNVRNHFINTPVVYKYDFKQNIGDRSFKYYVGAGPNVNFWLGGGGELSSVELREDAIDQLEYKVQFTEKPALPENGQLYIAEPNRVQVGLIISTGITLEPQNGQTFILDFRYEWGHSFLSEEEGRYTNVLAYRENLRGSTQAFQISLAYVFDIINKGKKERRMYYDK